MNDRTRRIPVGVNREDLDKIRADAKAMGMNLSPYVRKRLGLVKVRAGRPKKPLTTATDASDNVGSGIS